MTTNYYIQERPPCECCGRPFESRHIGNSAVGWCFALHIYPDEDISDLEDWKVFWKGKPIRDEYRHEVSEQKMLCIITEREREQGWEKKPYGYDSWEDFFRHNSAKKGPKGLLRSRVDGRHCVGHGAGTWDLFVGEFS